MKKTIVILIVILTFLTGFYSGQRYEKKETLNRALEIPEKDVFTNQDIEHILFNEPQL